MIGNQNSNISSDDSANVSFGNAESSESQASSSAALPVSIPLKTQTVFSEEYICEQKTAILKTIDKICTENDLQYFAVSRLLAGCVYYQNFIPDIASAPWEIALLRPDYEKLIEILRTKGPEYDLKLRRFMPKKFPRIANCIARQSVLELEDVYLSKVFEIIILPFDLLPGDPESRKQFSQEMKELNQIYDDILNWRTYKVKKQNLVQFIFKYPFYRKKSPKKHFETIQTHAQKYNDSPDASYAGQVSMRQSKQLSLEELLPLKRLPFRDMMLPCPQKYSIWNSAVYDALKQQLAISEDDLLLTKTFRDICQNLGLWYFTCNDMAPGRICYSGFVSYDNKVDTIMSRSDYETFLEKAPSFLDERFALETHQTAGENFSYTELHLTSIGAEPLFNRAGAKIPHNICLSIYPFDTLPETAAERTEFIQKVRGYALPDSDTKQIRSKFDNLKEESAKHIHQENAPSPETKSDSKKISKTDAQVTEEPDTLENQNTDEQAVPTVVPIKNQTVFSEEYICRQKTEILKTLDKICQEYHLEYFAISRLLVGCIHYQDFIPDSAAAPWEIALLRPDYEKLMEILQKNECKYNLKLRHYRTDKVPRLSNAVARQSVLNLQNVYVSKVFEVVILPFDKLPAAYDTRINFINKMDRLNTKFDKTLEWRAYKPDSQRLRTYLLKTPFYRFRNLDNMYEKIHKKAQSYNDDSQAIYASRIAMRRSKMIKLDQIFPIQKLPFRDMMLACPKDYSVWTPVIDEALQHQVTSIQQADLILAQKFDEICRKLGLGYFVCGGTMLGYMRHGGFIPWDDDVDVAMLRADYNRFLKEAGPLLDDRFFLQTRESDPKIPYLFSKLRLNNTEYVTAFNEHRNFHKGICLDIFPFDAVPNDLEEREKFVNQVLELSKKHNKIANNQVPEPVDGLPPRNLKEHWIYFKGRVKRFYYHHRSLAKTQKKYLKLATKYNSCAKELGLTTVASFVPSYTYIDYTDLLPYQDVTFNGITVKVPKDPDVFLTMQYGDYMEFPPKHQQVAHKLLRWSTDLKNEPNASGKE